jgi:dihydrofolate reductase
VIGRDNALPWHLPADLQRFKALTLGKPILMGRNTHQSIGRALPGRRNLVLSRGGPVVAAGVEVVHSLDAALLQVAGAAELMIIGGAQLYRATLGHAQRIHLTRVHTQVTGDAYFPELDPAHWRVTEALQVPADQRNAFAMTFTTLERAEAPGAG